MKVGVIDKRVKFVVLCMYITFPILGFYLNGIVLFIIALILVTQIDRIIPKWGYELSWGDIFIGIKNQKKYGCNGSRFIVMKSKFKIYIYRDDKDDPVRMGFMIPVKCWNGVLNKDDFEKIAKKFECYYHFIVFKREDIFAFFPYDRSPENILKILKFIIDNYAGGLSDNTKARIDGAREDIWLGANIERR